MRTILSALLLGVSVLLGAIAWPHPALAAGTRVVGQVIDAETLKPIAGADVELQNSGGGPGYHRARTNAQGEFVIDGAAVGRYYLFTVGAEGYTDWALESWQFPAAQREVRVAVPLDRAGQLTVRASAADGRTMLTGARVTVRSERSGAWWGQAQRDPDPRFTGKDGSVGFSGLAAGYYTVQVEAAGLRTNESRRVPVRRGENTPIALALTRPSSLAGQVRLPDSTGVAGVTVVARGPGEATATTDAQGYYVLGELAPGKWRIEAQHEGLEPNVARDGVVLAEGQSREGIDLRVTPRAPAFSFVLNREVFAPGDKQDIGVRAFRVGRIDLTLYRVPTSHLLDAKKDFRAAYVLGADTTGLVRVQSWQHQSPDGAPFAWREQEMTLPQEAAIGTYLLVGRSGRIERRQMFFVSDLSLLVKRSAARMVLWAGSLKTGVPLGEVALYTLGGLQNSGIDSGNDWAKTLAAARTRRMVTNPDGLAEIPMVGEGTGSRRIVAISESHGVAVVESPLSSYSARRGDAMFLFTERPIYRPGQRLYWKAFVRRAAAEGYALPDRTATQLSLAGPDGSALEIAPVTLSGNGAADGVVELPKDLPLGEYTLSATAGEASSSATFAIQEYRKPEYQVEVTPEREVIFNGDEARFRIAATYFFGAPVVGATVRYTLFESRLRAAGEWSEDGGEGEQGGYGRLLESGETRTDTDGRVQLTFTPQRVAYDRRLSLEVEVVDGAQRKVSARGTLVVGRGQFTIRLEPVRQVVMAGQPLQIDVTTLDHTGKPVSASVTVELDQDVWNPLERRYTRSSRPLASVTGSTSSLRGSMRATLAPGTAGAGYFIVRARAEDARGNKIGAETSLWVYDEKVWGYAYRYPSLEALPDRDAYAPGDTARILVNTDVKDASVLVSVEGRELQSYAVQHLFGNTGLVRVPIRAEYAPNIFVKLHVRRGREVQTRELQLAVQAVRHDLKITVTPDAARYRPQQEARLSVETRDAEGRPVAAEVAVGLVDESIYSLRADGTPKAHDVFYGKRQNGVTTVVSFPTLYYGGADKNDHNEPRKDFRDVALWAPQVRTGADGRAELRVKWPDNLTTWRATARGVSDGMLVGESIGKTLVTKDVVARLATPRGFTAGDEATLVSVVNNRTKQPLTGVAESIEVGGAARLLGASSVTSSLAAGGESRSRWAVTANPESPKDGSDASATFVFRAKAKSDADALELAVPITPRAVRLESHAAGTLDAATQSVTVMLPDALVRSGSSVVLELSPSTGAVALGGAEHLVTYPYGCTEQTSNALMPAAMLLSAARAAGVTLPGWEEPAKRLTPLVQRLFALRRFDGGWGWWTDSDADPYMTALAVDALACASLAGVQAEAARSIAIDARSSVLRALGELRSVDGEAYVAMHASRLLLLPDPQNELADLRVQLGVVAGSVYAQRQQLGAAGLACAAIASARLGRDVEARALLELLLQRARPNGHGLGLEADPLEVHPWFGEAIENTAYALEAISLIAPTDPRGIELTRWLLMSRTGRDWRSTRQTGPVVLALASYLGTHPTEWKGAGAVRAEWNGERVFDAVLGGATGFGAGTRVIIPGGKLKPGANALVLAREGSSAVHWAWSARANVPSPGPAVTETRVSVKREFLRATRTTDRRGRPRWLVSPLEAKIPIRVGESILVRLTLSAPRDQSFLMIEDPKPAGFEIDAVLPDGVDRPWNTHAEARDDRAVFFLDTLESGDTVIEYLIRPEMEGAFTALPARVSGMYDPDLATRSGEARLRVQGR